ncbi:hypothetical protein JXI42_12165 [bacterium]|nr:hypothetical protein [bacterium]
MKKLLGIVTLVLSSTVVWAQPSPPPSPDAVPVGLIAIPVIAVGAIGYGIYKIAKKKD